MLPTPNLDDRRFQDLVDDAKRLVQQRCPEWTDHNVSDPGVTLIETFAFLVDTLLYRLNRVPDRLYVKFLELIGQRLEPPAAARVELTFWLATPQPRAVVVPADTGVTSPRNGSDEPLLFMTTQDLVIPPAHLLHVARATPEGAVIDLVQLLALDEPVHVLSDTPRPGEAILFGLDTAVPDGVVRLDLDCTIDGVGVEPDDPPIAWEALGEAGWQPCDLLEDTTGALNRRGRVTVQLPGDHVMAVAGRHSAGWIRARVTEHHPEVPGFYVSPPRVAKVGAAVVGGRVEAVNARRFTNEIVGTSDGTPGQRFTVQHGPIVRAVEEPIVEVSTGEGWERWSVVDTFGDRTDRDPVVLVDSTAGTLEFGPAVREADGSLHRYGRVPAAGARIRVASYRVGGGRAGNVSAGTLTVMRNKVPFVVRVENRTAAEGGRDAETMEALKLRAPVALQTRGRAVTADDYEEIAREAAPEFARVRVTEQHDPATAGVVRLLVVPDAPCDSLGRTAFGDLVPRGSSLRTVGAALEARRCVGARVVVEPPRYQGITVVARLRSQERVQTERVGDRALEALYTHFDAIRGGRRGMGWEFGRPVTIGEIFGVLQRVDGVEYVEEALLFGADPVNGLRGAPTQRIDLPDDTLVFSFEHQILVERADP